MGVGGWELVGWLVGWLGLVEGGMSCGAGSTQGGAAFRIEARVGVGLHVAYLVLASLVEEAP